VSVQVATDSPSVVELTEESTTPTSAFDLFVLVTRHARVFAARLAVLDLMMKRALHHFKVFRVVVALVTVHMVDLFAGKKAPPQLCFCYESVLVSITAYV
jgi:hypothetical protein